MYYVRYLIVFVCELFWMWPIKRHIHCEGHKKGTIGSLLSWCAANARFSATHRHPLWVCVRRDKFPDWMMGKEE